MTMIPTSKFERNFESVVPELTSRHVTSRKDSHLGNLEFEF